MRTMRSATIVALTGAALLVHAGVIAAPSWAVDPAQPGPHLPPTGRSVFDELTVDGVPFPFESLVRRIEERSCPMTRCTTAVLIPLGRSLQRTAAAPDFLAFPRVVVAVTGEARGPLHARDRLYLGYQERAQLIEVISYNEAAARFEFQLVRNYGPGVQPEVVYAERALCTACHQNQAPIFSRQVWDESNANPRVAAEVAAASGRSRIHGVQIRRGIDFPNAIDDSTDRANAIATIQRIWRDACDSPCRARALTAALQYRLSDEQGFDAAPALRARFATRWPDGLAMPSADLPNRDPFAAGSASDPAAIDIAAAFEALAPRGPGATWHADDPALDARFVAGLAALLAENDVRAFTALLAQRAGQVHRRTYTARCVPRGMRYLCFGEFELEGSASSIDRLTVSGRSTTRFQLRDGRAIRHGRAVRLASGDAIERIRLPAEGVAGVATLTVLEDFEPTRSKIAATQWSDDPLTRDRLRAVLGMGDRASSTTGVAPSVKPAATTPAIPPVAAPFMASCGACHRTTERSPPNFLAGDAERIKASLTQCAPRMYVRLSMWQSPAAARAKVPMPPPRASHDGRPSIQHQADPEIAELRATVAGWLRTETGRAPDAAAMLTRGYENLRPCLLSGS